MITVVLWTGNGVNTVTGLTAHQNVVEEYKIGQEPAQTLPQLTVEQTVRESPKKLRNAIQMSALQPQVFERNLVLANIRSISNHC